MSFSVKGPGDGTPAIPSRTINVSLFGMSTGSESKYVPAAGHDWLLPLYDPCIRLCCRSASYAGS